MFQNSFQAGQSFEIFDPKDAVNKSNKEKEKFYQSLYKVNTPQHVQKLFEKTLKCYIFEIEGHNTKIQFPKDGDLGLVQQFLVLQLNIGQSINWGLELIVTDTSKTKRRIMLASSSKTLEKKFFHLKTPIDIIKRNVWLNLCVDVWSFMEGFKGQTFRTLDMIILSAPCKLRKVFSSKTPLDENNHPPKNVNFPSTVPYQNQLVNFRNLNYDLEFEESQVSKKQIFATQFTVSQQRSTQQQSQGGTPLKQKIQPQKKQQQQFEQQEVEEQIAEENFNDYENEFEQSEFKSDNFDIVGQKMAKGPQKMPSQPSNVKKQKLPLAKVYSRQNNNENNSEVSVDPKKVQLSHSFIKQNLEQIQRSPLNNQNHDLHETKPQKSSQNPWNARSTSRNRGATQQQAASPQSGQPTEQKQVKIQNRKQQMREQQIKELQLKEQQRMAKINEAKQAKLTKKPGKKEDADKIEESKNNLENDEDDYYQRTQKFSTITDQKAFQYAREEEQGEDDDDQQEDGGYQEEEIEEYIEEDTIQSNAKEKLEKVESNSQLMEDKKGTDKNFNKRSISELKPAVQSDQKNNNEQFEDSLEMPYGTSYGMNAQNTKSQQKWQKGQLKDEKEDSEATFAEGFYANQLKKYTEIQSRPFTPPYDSIVQLKSNNVHRIEEEEVKGYEDEDEENEMNESNDNVLEVVYDPVMNCYYDPHTNQYYELKD